MAMSEAGHRRARAIWAIGAPVCLAIGILGRTVLPILALASGPSTWIWFVVGAAYHHGWLRRHRDGSGHA